MVGWHTNAVSLPPGDLILAQLACPLNEEIFCLHHELPTYLSTNIDTTRVKHLSGVGSWPHPQTLD